MKATISQLHAKNLNKKLNDAKSWNDIKIKDNNGSLQFGIKVKLEVESKEVCPDFSTGSTTFRILRIKCNEQFKIFCYLFIMAYPWCYRVCNNTEFYSRFPVSPLPNKGKQTGYTTTPAPPHVRTLHTSQLPP